MSTPDNQPPASFWNRTAYMAANDINTVAVYRMISIAMGGILLALLGYFGTRLVAAEDRNGTDLTTAMANITALHADMADFKASLVVTNMRADYFGDRLNGFENRLTVIEVRTGARK